MFEKRESETENEKCVKKSTSSPPQTAKIKYNWEKSSLQMENSSS